MGRIVTIHFLVRVVGIGFRGCRAGLVACFILLLCRPVAAQDSNREPGRPRDTLVIQALKQAMERNQVGAIQFWIQWNPGKYRSQFEKFLLGNYYKKATTAQAKNKLTFNIGGIASIAGRTVTFKSGDTETFDAVVFCTGFEFSIPFLETRSQFKDIRECHLQMFHPTLRDCVAFIGFVRPQQGGMRVAGQAHRHFIHAPANWVSCVEHVEIEVTQPVASSRL